MALLIDGYNLLHAVGILSGTAGPGELERARSALLNFLVDKLDPSELRETTVVFDSHDAPRRLPRRMKHREVAVYFAAEYVDADEMIEELIRGFPTPQRLTVVSSDHHIQRAARRRKARTIDSDDWYFDLALPPAKPLKQPVAASTETSAPLGSEEVSQWLERFGGAAVLEEIVEEEQGTETASAGEPAKPPGADVVRPPDKPTAKEAQAIGNPFPPGYAEDLFEDGSTQSA